MRFKVSKGQEICIVVRNMFHSGVIAKQCIITSINSKSIYAKDKESDEDDSYRYKLNKHTGIGRNSIGDIYEAYPAIEVYNEKIARINKEEVLCADICQAISRLKLEDLVSVQNHILEITGSMVSDG